LDAVGDQTLVKIMQLALEEVPFASIVVEHIEAEKWCWGQHFQCRFAVLAV